MYFSRITLNQNASLTRLSRLAQQGYGAHQSLWQLFAENKDRDFLYHRIQPANWPCFYVVSKNAPVDSEDLWKIETKAYSPTLDTGQLLGFTLCANPVITHKNSDGKPIRHDVIMDAKRLLRAKEHEISLVELIQTEGERWLTKRGEKRGFAINAVRVDGYRQQRLYKSKNSKKDIRFSTLDFNGMLQITNPTLFRQTLFHGIGPAKAFGCGLLLVRKL